jgi:hypothetical protein
MRYIHFAWTCLNIWENVLNGSQGILPCQRFYFVLGIYHLILQGLERAISPLIHAANSAPIVSLVSRSCYFTRTSLSRSYYFTQTFVSRSYYFRHLCQGHITFIRHLCQGYISLLRHLCQGYITLLTYLCQGYIC